MPTEQKRRIRIFDTTLRDGEQSPGASMNNGEKLEIAQALEALGVDVIEAGFPIACPDDFEAVQRHRARDQAGRPWPASPGASRRTSTPPARPSKRPPSPRIHVFLATSAIHREFKLRKAKEEIVRLAVEGVKLAKDHGADVEFSPEDASRTELDFLCEVVEAVIDAGATTVNIPDTVGYAMPEQYGELIAYLRERVPNIDKAVISVHCHNDLGLAVANSLAAVADGAGQVECTINGIGERAGNCCARRDRHGPRARGRTSSTARPASTPGGSSPPAASCRRSPASRCSATRPSSARTPSPTRRASTRTACSRSARPTRSCGPRTSASRRPSWCWASTAAATRCASASRRWATRSPTSSSTTVFEHFKVLADKKKEIYDADLEALIEDEMRRGARGLRAGLLPRLERQHHRPDGDGAAQDRDGEILQDAACGDGPVDAVYKTIDRITGMTGTLADYNIRAVTSRPGRARRGGRSPRSSAA